MEKEKLKLKLKLSLAERIFLNSILPKVGKEETLIVSRDLKNKIKFTQEEIELYKIETEEDSISWNNKGDEVFLEIELSVLEELLFKRLLSDVNNKELIPELMLDFYLKYK